MRRPSSSPSVRPGGVSLREGAARRAAAVTVAGMFALTAFFQPGSIQEARADDPAKTLSEAASSGIDPLTLDIDEVTPSVLKPDGTRPVVLSGTVTNVSDEAWTAVNVAPFRSATPITSTRGLADAAATASNEYVGDRLTDVASLTTIDNLAPGESARFSTTIPRSALGSAPGVYWVGVHAIGQTTTRPRDEVADGRARTFLPVASSTTQTTQASLVLPVRARVRHEPDGTLSDANSWSQSLSEGGQLHDLLAAGRAGADHAVTWLIDPAVLHAVAQLASRNTGWSLTASDGAVPHLPDEFVASPPQSSESPSPSPSTTPDDGPQSEELDEAGQIALAASQWLTDFLEIASNGRAALLALPYGDVDVAAVSRQSPELLKRAQERGLAVLTTLGLDATPAVAPIDGVLPAGSVSNTLPETVLLLNDTMLSTGDAAPTPSTGTILGRSFVAASGGITDGGPGPEDPGTPIAVRQRTLSEAAVRSLNGDENPIVVLPPASWDSAAGTQALAGAFNAGLLTSVSMSSVTGSAREASTTLESSALEVSNELREGFLPRRNVRIAARLAGRGALLEEMLSNPAGMDLQAQDMALTSLAHSARNNPATRAKRAAAADAHLAGLVAQVTIQGPSVVTLSGASGRLGATVRNGLDVPVTVNVEADSGASIELDVPNPVTVAPDSRNRLLLPADRVQQGVSRVTLSVTTLSGEKIGAEDSFSVRSSQVSGILWLFIGGGAAVLFGAIGIRFFRRGLASRREQGVA